MLSLLAGRDQSNIKEDYQSIMQLRQAVAENQHHDAVCLIILILYIYINIIIEYI